MFRAEIIMIVAITLLISQNDLFTIWNIEKIILCCISF